MILVSTFFSSVLVLAAGVPGDQERGSSKCKDKTGIEWVSPFPEALAKATKEQRLLMIKPVAFGTTSDGGW